MPEKQYVNYFYLRYLQLVTDPSIEDEAVAASSIGRHWERRSPDQHKATSPC
jgi:hypothetical protein